MFKRIKKSLKELFDIVLFVVMLAVLILVYIFACDKIEPDYLPALIMFLTIVATIVIYNKYKSLFVIASKDDIQERLAELHKSNEGLSRTNQLLKNEIDIMKQTQQLIPQYKTARQLQVLTISKSGHLVKEENLLPLKQIDYFVEDFPTLKLRIGFGRRDIEPKDNIKVFFSDNKIYTYSIGIKLDEILCAFNNNCIYLRNVTLCRLNRIEDDYKEYNPELDATNHVWVVTKKESRYQIINDPQHYSFKEKYKSHQRTVAGKTIQDAIANMCEYYTQGLRRILISRYGKQIHFTDDSEKIEDIQWMTLSDGIKISPKLSSFINDLYLTFDTMELCADKSRELDKALIPNRNEEPDQVLISNDPIDEVLISADYIDDILLS